jgi:hypothetical protein
VDFHESKWNEINLAAEILGWTRFKPAADWLAEHRVVATPRNQGQSPADVKMAFEQFLENYGGGVGPESALAARTGNAFHPVSAISGNQKGGAVGPLERVRLLHPPLGVPSSA